MERRYEETDSKSEIFYKGYNAGKRKLQLSIIEDLASNLVLEDPSKRLETIYELAKMLMRMTGAMDQDGFRDPEDTRTGLYLDEDLEAYVILNDSVMKLLDMIGRRKKEAVE